MTYWAKAPSPDRLTWVEYCLAVGRSPEWTDTDREGLRPPIRN
ncbi:hypothetical protein ACFQV2_07535 [Actinokineospora soli]|uniref:Uncharacterized protein n=1 Tax=Actinokineospora soli TaxID=1048753 RepID=A0ABW2TJR9_9PSEU